MSPVCLFTQKGGGGLSRKRKLVSACIFGVLIALLIAGIFLTGSPGRKEPVNEVMKDAVLHGTGKISLFGLIDVNPGLISAFAVSGTLIILAIAIRIFAVPRFTPAPGRLQYVLEKCVGYFSSLAKENSPHKPGFVGAYIFAAGLYIFMSTLFELFGIQAATTSGGSISLPAPLSDINGAIAMGFFSYGVILFGGLFANGPKGMLKALKDFSLPLSMSFRLFGALLSGALVTELVYYYSLTSYVIPVIVAVLFTLLHALIQAYVLTMLVSIFYGESTEPSHKKEKRKNNE
ncbi:MAG: F0F1 ATP synthase subunit A [Clostridia bacterium]|nr:F0F1 ATP synthase subunit A [Clostridia bacterium]